MDPFELRRKNYSGRENTLGERMIKSNGDMDACADKVQKEVFSAPRKAEDENFYYGRGFAAVMKSPKGAPFSTKGCYMKLNIDGSVSINMGGCRSRTGVTHCDPPGGS